MDQTVVHALFDITNAYLDLSGGNVFYNMLDTSILLAYLGELTVSDCTFSNITLYTSLFRVVESNLQISSSVIYNISNSEGEDHSVFKMYTESTVSVTDVNITD